MNYIFNPYLGLIFSGITFNKFLISSRKLKNINKHVIGYMVVKSITTGVMYSCVPFTGLVFGQKLYANYANHKD